MRTIAALTCMLAGFSAQAELSATQMAAECEARGTQHSNASICVSVCKLAATNPSLNKVCANNHSLVVGIQPQYAQPPEVAPPPTPTSNASPQDDQAVHADTNASVARFIGECQASSHAQARACVLMCEELQRRLALNQATAQQSANCRAAHEAVTGT
jgi:hypothetical protein